MGSMAPLGNGLPYSTRAVTIARQRGLLSILPMALWAQANALTAQGRFKLAYSAAEEGIRLASDFGHRSGASWNLTVVALLDALRGDESAGARSCRRGEGACRDQRRDVDRRFRRVGARNARTDARKAGRGDRPPAARDRRRWARIESTDRAVVDPRPDRSGGTLRAARRDGGSVRPLRGLGAALVVAGAPVRARSLPRACGRGRRARAIRDRARARRDPLAVRAGPHRAALRRVAATQAPAARGARASAQGCRPLPTRSARRRGRSAPRRSCARPARPQGGATPRRSTSSPRRSCRSPGSSPPA